jgi:hypothetical protein
MSLGQNTSCSQQVPPTLSFPAAICADCAQLPSQPILMYANCVNQVGKGIRCNPQLAGPGARPEGSPGCCCGVL